MEMSNLFKVLKEHHEFMRTYLEVLIQHRQAVINGNINELEETIKNEGAILIIIESYQNKVVDIIKCLSDKYSLGLKYYRLSELINAIKNSYDTAGLSKMRDSLIQMGNEIMKINNQNKMLIDQARNLIKQTITAVVNNKKVPILDRTI